MYNIGGGDDMFTKEILYNDYIVQEKPMKQIAEEYGVAVGTIYNYIKRYDIQSRHHMTEKAKEQIRQKNKGRPSANKGKKLSQETKEKMSKAKMGKFRNPSAMGGHKKHRVDGYVAIYMPTHSRATKDGYVMEHDLLMEQKIGRPLKDDEVVHHINKIRDDNRIENLQLMTFREHASFHMKERHKKRRDDLLTP